MATAPWNDATPVLGVLFEGLALEGVDLVSDKAGHYHYSSGIVFPQ
jgi:hypothetical protein